MPSLPNQPPDPSDAIYTTNDDAQYKTVDPVWFLTSTLIREWNQDNTDGIKPIIRFAEDTKDIVFGGQDWLTIFLVSEVSRPATINYTHKNVDLIFTLDYITAKDRRHIGRMVAEVERIFDTHRVDTFGTGTGLPGRFWIQYLRGTPFERTAKGYYRKTSDWQVRWRYKLIQT